MAQQQQNISVQAPGFMGLNTQDSPVGMDIAFASIADNCVIDKLGRIASRKGFKQYTSNPEILDEPVDTVHEFIDETGQVWVFACADDKVFMQELGGAQELIEMTLPGAHVGNNWQMTSFNNKVYFVQEGQKPILFDPDAIDPMVLEYWVEEPITGDYPNTATAGFGHLWTADWDTGLQRIYWSDFLDGDGYGRTSGFYDLEQFWPSGYDQVIAIKVHNDFLIVFGERSILVYAIPVTGPVDGRMVDTVEGIGCIARDSIQPTGTDFYFVDYTGVRSFGRTIQEKSMPVGDISLNVRTDIKADILRENKKEIRSVYDPEDSFYGVFMPSLNTSYIFDTREMLENGAFRPTRWPNIGIHCSAKAEDRETWYGGNGGLYQYTGANDVGSIKPNFITQTVPINMSYWTHPQTWGDSVTLKFPKQLDITLIGSEELTMFIRWAFDFQSSTDFTTLVRSGGAVWQYNINEYGEAEYSGASTLIATEQFNIWGQGRNIKFGFEAAVNSRQLSFQEINIQALMGRIL
jgi:hypothetical protein